MQFRTGRGQWRIDGAGTPRCPTASPRSSTSAAAEIGGGSADPPEPPDTANPFNLRRDLGPANAGLRAVPGDVVELTTSRAAPPSSPSPCAHDTGGIHGLALNGTFVEACDCRLMCPCWTDDEPDDGHCTGLFAWSLDAGSTIDGLLAVGGAQVVCVTTHLGRRRGGNATARGLSVLFVDTSALPPADRTAVATPSARPSPEPHSVRWPTSRTSTAPSCSPRARRSR